jgi:hypothetical protein
MLVMHVGPITQRQQCGRSITPNHGHAASFTRWRVSIMNGPRRMCLIAEQLPDRDRSTGCG